MNFRVGQKVVCVDDSRLPDEPGPYVVKGNVYTIIEIYEEDTIQEGVSPHLLFAELPVVEKDPWTRGYFAGCFRPAVEGKTDTGMAILKQILSDVKAGKVKEIVDA